MRHAGRARRRAAIQRKRRRASRPRRAVSRRRASRPRRAVLRRRASRPRRAVLRRRANPMNHRWPASHQSRRPRCGVAGRPRPIRQWHAAGARLRRYRSHPPQTTASVHGQAARPMVAPAARLARPARRPRPEHRLHISCQRPRRGLAVEERSSGTWPTWASVAVPEPGRGAEPSSTRPLLRTNTTCPLSGRNGVLPARVANQGFGAAAGPSGVCLPEKGRRGGATRQLSHPSL